MFPLRFVCVNVFILISSRSFRSRRGSFPSWGASISSSRACTFPPCRCPRKALRGGIQKPIVTDLSGNLGDSRQMLIKTSQRLQKRASDTPTKGLVWRANMSHMGRSRPDMALALRLKFSKRFNLFHLRWEVVRSPSRVATCPPLHQQPEVNHLARFSLQLISLER